jgi:cytochrome c554/c'-like protein
MFKCDSSKRGLAFFTGALPVVVLLSSLIMPWHLALAAAAVPQPGQTRAAAPASDDDILGGDANEPATSPPAKPTPETTPAVSQASGVAESDAAKAHQQLFVENRFPSATVCRTCHPDQYREWSMSQHSYSQLSPVLQAMQGLVLKLTNGTFGDFCIRCHNQVGMNLGEPLFMSSIDRHPASREGVTCIVCHRIDQNYGKISGRLAIVEGSLFTPVYGPTGDAELKRVLENRDQYRVVTDPKQPGRGIHTDIERFPRISTAGFCGMCHDVTLPDNLRLEEAFSEWKNSPAAKDGVTCQDCHMSTEPGKPSGYATGPAANVGGVPTRPRKRADHRFVGPDYSVVHPGVFPHNTRAQELATIREWLTFDYRAGWGTDAFEKNVPKDYKFPPRWTSLDDRMDARAIIDENLKKLDEMAAARKKLLQIGYRLEDVVVDRADDNEIAFRVQVRNGTNGHNAPTGLDNERMVYLEVAVTDSQGKVVFRSGDRDPNGDIRDQHSTYVNSGDVPLDAQAFSLRSKFVVSMVRGGDREQVAPTNISIDALPYTRPETRPAILTGAPTSSRKHKRGIPPLGERWATYTVSADDLKGSTGPYKANVKLIAGMIPINLLNVIQIVGFDFFMSPRQVGAGVIGGYQVLWERDVPLQVNDSK